MKKLFTILVAMASLMMANAQNSFTPLTRQIAPGQLEKLQFAQSPLRSTTTVMTINYDSTDRYYAAHNAGDTVFPTTASGLLNIWPINSNYDSSYHFTLKYAVQVYDTLVNVNNHFAAVSRNGATIRVDSFLLFLTDTNGTKSKDSFTVTVFDQTAVTTTGSGYTETFNTPALWTRTYSDTANFFGPGSGNYVYLVPFYPNVTLPVGHTFGIRVDFKGNIADQFAVAASYRNDCGTNNTTGLASAPATAPLNSSYYLNYGALSSIIDWGTATVVGSGACDLVPLQNFYFYPSITVVSPNGINSIDAGVSNFNIFPNPSNGVFNADIKLETASDVTTTVVDMIGNKVYESTDKTVTELNKNINLSSVAPGMYIVNVKTATGSVNQRIVIK